VPAVARAKPFPSPAEVGIVLPADAAPFPTPAAVGVELK
jgi:hypothetical protein